MKRRYQLLWLLVVILLAAVGGIWLHNGYKEPTRPAGPENALESLSENLLQPLLPLSAVSGLSPERIALGKRLFHDARLSADFSVTCASCHNLSKGGVDGRRVSTGIHGAQGGINAPSALNAAYNFVQFWDGRAATLEAQVAGPIHNPIEMGSNWAQVMTRLGQDSQLLAEFARAYPDGLTIANIADAIATFERSLITVNSRFDRYLRGEVEVLTPLEKEGLQRFQDFGCVSCHQGRLIGGNMFQKFGVMSDYFAERPSTVNDLGRFNVTGVEADRHVFKVPSLRNVALTAPYFHDGSAETLEQAVLVMGRYQLGRDISEQEVAAIVAFLKTLTGELPLASIQ